MKTLIVILASVSGLLAQGKICYDEGGEPVCLTLPKAAIDALTAKRLSLKTLAFGASNTITLDVQGRQATVPIFATNTEMLIDFVKRQFSVLAGEAKTPAIRAKEAEVETEKENHRKAVEPVEAAK